MSELSPKEQLARNALQEKKPRVFDKIQRYASIVQNGGSIGIVQFQYNYACNFSCTHCSISRMKRDGVRSLTPPDVKMIADQADKMGLAHWVITGGEPLVFPDFLDLIFILYFLGPLFPSSQSLLYLI